MESVSIEGHLKEINSFWIKEKQILSHDIIRSVEITLCFGDPMDSGVHWSLWKMCLELIEIDIYFLYWE